MSVAAEGFAPGLSTFTPMVEWRPFRKDDKIGNERFRLVGYNKTLSETFYDMSVQGIIGYTNMCASKLVKGQLTPMKSLEMKLINNLFFPTMHSGYQASTQVSADVAKNKLEKKGFIGKDTQ